MGGWRRTRAVTSYCLVSTTLDGPRSRFAPSTSYEPTELFLPAVSNAPSRAVGLTMSSRSFPGYLLRSWKLSGSTPHRGRDSAKHRVRRCTRRADRDRQRRPLDTRTRPFCWSRAGSGGLSDARGSLVPILRTRRPDRRISDGTAAMALQTVGQPSPAPPPEPRPAPPGRHG